jgi:hypothetical protein
VNAADRQVIARSLPFMACDNLNCIRFVTKKAAAKKIQTFDSWKMRIIFVRYKK